MTEQPKPAKDVPADPHQKPGDPAAGETAESFTDEPLADARGDPAWEAPIGRPIEPGEETAPEAPRSRSQTSRRGP